MATKKVSEEKTTAKKTAAKKTTEVKEEVVVKTTAKEEKKETKNEKTITGLSVKGEIVLIYLIPILGLVFALMKDKEVSKKLRFHYNQSATVFIANIVMSIAFGILGAFVPFSSLISNAVSVVLLVFVIIAIVKAYNDEETYKIPVISELSKSIFCETIED